MKRISLPMARAFLAALVIAGGGCRDQSHVLTLVLAVKGDATLAGSAVAGLSPGTEFAPPAIIRTVADSAIVFSPLPGVVLRLEAGGEIAIEAVELRKRGEEVESRVARLDLRRGCARVWMDEFRRGATEVRIRTAAGDVICRGATLAEVVVEAGGSARVICVSGALSAARTTLSAGEWAAWSPGDAAPAAQVAADRDDVWKILLETRDLEPQFVDLQARQRTRTPLRPARPAASGP